MKSNKINNVKELRDELIDVFDELKNGKIGLREAKERTNTAGKILNSAKLELEYNAYTKTQRIIPFLEVE